MKERCDEEKRDWQRDFNIKDLLNDSTIRAYNMQNWEAMQPNAHFDQHNSWYNSMFAAQIKTEPGTTPPPPPTAQGQTAVNATPTTSQLEHYLSMKQQQQHHQNSAMDTMSAMTPSPSNNDSLQHHFYDSNMQQQLLQHQQQQQQQQQQHYQQQFQAAQQAAAQQSQAAQMPLGFNPLTPPGLPSAVLPPMSHFYGNHSNMRPNQHQTPSPQPGPQLLLSNTPLDSAEKIPTALTPRNTPPMDVTPPKSPKSLSGLPSQQEQEKDQDLISNSSEDMKYMAESEDDESIRMPIYNSHGKMKNYKCKTCGLVAITKIAFWEHARSHMKPEKILQCPKCPFVTELKHHLEYHIRKHKNLKPFQCDKCSYSCVNKSMLNSHRKSHSSVYQYRCADCDYATKYCHSFKLHLRKYDHKPGMVLDEEGIPNPSVVIDVYGTRRGPKSKSGSSSGGGGSAKRNNSASNAGERLTSANLSTQINNSSQLSAALQGFPMPQHQMPASPAKSCSSTASELPAQPPKKKQSAPQSAQQQMPNLLSTIMQQNHNMAFFPYWNLNLQMLAAQQQAAVLAQLSPRMRETAMQQLQGQQNDNDIIQSDEDDDNEEEDEAEFDGKSVDSAMDLSQGTPTKEEEEQQRQQQQQQQQHQQQQQQTPAVAMNLKLPEASEVISNETPLMSSVSNTSRRKGRVLKLDTLLQGKTASLSPEQPKKNSSTGSSSEPQISDAPSSADESMETSSAAPAATSTPPAANTSASSTASSSGNSSNSSSTSSTGNPNGAIYECKYCDIYFKDAVLYTIHMGYHSCDDVFKCNMCGEKCDGPVGLFVHMARNAHS